MIEDAKKDDLQNISSLMNSVFGMHMKEGYNQEGRDSFCSLISVEALHERFEQSSEFYVYKQDGAIKGVLELESGFHIAFLFVEDRNKGIGTALCEKIINIDNDLLSVAAFPGTVSFYQKLGFHAVDEERTVNGMPFVLMIKQNG